MALLDSPLRSRWRALRRGVLRRRRSLAALLTAVAVGSGVRAVAPPPEPTEPVLVAARDVPAGSVLGADDVTVVRYRVGTVPEGASDAAADAVGRRTAGALGLGEPVTTTRLLGPGLADEGRVATPVRLPDAGMADLLEVGDVVDLVAADPTAGTATTVAADVPVLATPSDADGPATGGLGAGAGGLSGGRLVVVGLEPDDVTDVADAAARTLVTFTWSAH
ncbi:MAG: pilus assembly protein CpaB [Nocardioides sp.]|nr:pilus assembly protein CpaB [Nocardioides sp.]